MKHYEIEARRERARERPCLAPRTPAAAANDTSLVGSHASGIQGARHILYLVATFSHLTSFTQPKARPMRAQGLNNAVAGEGRSSLEGDGLME